MLPEPLRETLHMVVIAMQPARDPWWIIASAAMALHGATPIEVADVDLLMSEADAAALIARLGLVPPPPAPSDRFRSAIFLRWEAPPVPVEIMAGFEVRVDGAWRPILPVSRIAIPIDGGTLPVPAISELIEHCQLYGRPKDAGRAAILQRLPS